MKERPIERAPRAEDFERIRRELQESEDRYRTLVESSPDNIVIHDLEGRILFTNASRVEVLGGKSPEDIIGRNAMDFVHPEDRDFVTGKVMECLEDYKNGRFSIRTIEHRFVRLDGSVFQGEATGVPFIYRGELAMQVIVRDITERKLAQEALGRARADLEKKVGERTAELSELNRALKQEIREHMAAEAGLKASEEKYRMLIDRMNDGFGWMDGDGVITFINDKFCSMLGYSREELLGRRVESLFDEENRKIMLEQIEKRKSGIREPYEIEFMRKDGNPLPAITSPEPVFDDAGNFEGSFAVITDMTVFKRIEKEREELLSQLFHARKMEAVGTLAGGIAHDFNNIMTVIKNMTSLAMRKIDEKSPVRAYLEPLREVSERASRLVQQLLIFSRNKPVETELIQLNGVVDGTLGILGSLMGEDVSVEKDLDQGLLAIKADRGRIEQVITNLVLNGAEAMPEGGRIRITTKSRLLSGAGAAGDAGRYVILTVEDEGTGMDEETRSHIFEPFFTTRAPKGTGLGLSVVYGIVDEMGGRIEVSSEPGRGSRFSLYFPVSSGPGAPEADRGERAEP